jgi:beta-glucuronidase
MRRRLPSPLLLAAVALVTILLVLPLAAQGAVGDEPATTTPTTPTATTPKPPPSAPPTAVATVPDGKPLYQDGQVDRVVVNGPWLFRLDTADAGLGQRFYDQSTTVGWSTVSVPNAWNARDDSVASFSGSVGWYRKDFRLPPVSKAKKPTPQRSYVLRFESVNFYATIWLNGRQIATHSGGYLPFEVRLPNASATGVNRLVVRVDNRRTLSDQHGSRAERPIPPGGWWNYGGILREVYLRTVNRIDLTNVNVATKLPNPAGAATVTTSADVRNATGSPQLVHLSGRFGSQPVDLGTRTVPAGQTLTLSGRITVKRPKLWSPAHPNLYAVRLAATAQQPGEQRPIAAAGYRLETGIRSIKVDGDGQLLLNGEVVHFRGVAIHEDTLTQGAAMDNAVRARLVALTKDVGATLVRSHYPLHPEFQELADREGLLLWSEVPAMYQLPEANLGKTAYRNLAFDELRANVLSNRAHPSVAIWSVGNEMPSVAGPNQSAYIADATKVVKQLDPTRPVGLAFAGHPEAGCQPGYASLDVLGMNDYFGWYTGVGGNIADQDQLSSYLDTLRTCYPHKAVAVTEYGAEANRDGPVEEKGTYKFQDAFVQFHLGVFASKPWLTGSVYWALQEFRVKPFWSGGNPWPDSPIHAKGLVRLDWTKKPAYAILRAGYRATRQFVPRSSAKKQLAAAKRQPATAGT